MNNIEKLAKDFGAKYVIEMPCEYYKFTPEQLEAFAKAYSQQQSEPVGVCAQESFGGGQVFWFKEQPTDGTKLYTDPPNTVLLEKYNKVVEWVKQLGHEVERRGIKLTIEGKDFRQAIAEAEAQHDIQN